RTSPARPPSVGGGGPGEGQPMPAALARSASGSVGSVAVSGAVEGSVEAPATLSEVSAAPAPTSFDSADIPEGGSEGRPRRRREGAGPGSAAGRSSGGFQPMPSSSRQSSFHFASRVANLSFQTSA